MDLNNQLMSTARMRMAPAEVARLFNPKSIAVVGASANPERFSGKIIPSLLRQGYRGAIYPVNPGRDTIGGLPCYPDLAAVPGEVDCVVYALAAEHIEAVLEQCREKRVRLMVVSSAGFAERGDAQGEAMQESMLARARVAGVRVLGPNCIGFINMVNRVCVSSAAAASWPDIPRGGIGLVSQSGGLGLATILYSALEEGISFSHIVTTGNEADLDTIDIVRYLIADDATDVIAMTVEAVRDKTAFFNALQEAKAVGKPVVVLKSGRTELGKTMAASHTGALAGSAAVFEAVCAQYGAICANDVDDFYQIAAMLAKLRRGGKLKTFKNPGAHCAALSISGGHIGLFADHASLAGLVFPAFSRSTQAAIARELGFDGNFQNPLDTTARTIGDDGFWGRCASVLLDDEAIEIVVPIITVARTYEAAIRDFIDIAQRSGKIIVVVWAGGDFEGEGWRLLMQSNLPVFRTPSRAAAAIHALDSYCRGRDADLPPAIADDTDGSLAKAGLLLRQYVAAGRSALTERESKHILYLVGFPVTREQGAESVEQALAAAQSIGYPVALKGEHPQILHKTELGLVFLGVNEPAGVRQAFAQAMAVMSQTAPGHGKVLVQEMADPGTELILGVTSDAEFGPVVVLGLGGIFVEILQDVSMRAAPFDQWEAMNMIDGLRGGRLLQGVRGQAAVDRGELARLLVRLSQFAHANADLISEIDVNPLVLDKRKKGLLALDALIVLKQSASAAPELRL